MYQFPPLKDGDKDFNHFKIKDWYKSSRELPKVGYENVGFNILLIRPSSRGDVLLLTPIIRQLKALYPCAAIDVATIHDELFKCNPLIRKVIKLYNKRYFVTDFVGGYDYVYWMSYEFTPQLHIVDSYANIIGIRVDDYRPSLHLSMEERNKTKDIHYNYLKPYICIHRECTWRSRKWSDSSWSLFVEKFKKKYPEIGVIVLSENDEVPIKETIQFSKLDFRKVCSIINGSKMLVCVDSGLMHMGIALDKPVVSLFSITDPNKRLPNKWLKLSLQIDSLYAGIHHRGNVPSESEPEDCNYVLDMISPQEVFNKCDMIMQLIESKTDWKEF